MLQQLSRHSKLLVVFYFNLSFFIFFITELKGPVGQMIQTDNRGLLAVERNKVDLPVFYVMFKI